MARIYEAGILLQCRLGRLELCLYWGILEFLGAEIIISKRIIRPYTFPLTSYWVGARCKHFTLAEEGVPWNVEPKKLRRL